MVESLREETAKVRSSGVKAAASIERTKLGVKKGKAREGVGKAKMGSTTSVRRHVHPPVSFGCQTLIVPVRSVETSSLPSARKLSELTPERCPVNLAISAPVEKGRSVTVPS